MSQFDVLGVDTASVLYFVSDQVASPKIINGCKKLPLYHDEVVSLGTFPLHHVTLAFNQASSVVS